MSEVGTRVATRIAEVAPERLHREIALEIGMTPDAFSRALSGKRNFSSLELVKLSQLLDADVHWLVTGMPDPNRIVVAARHDYDPVSRARSVPGQANDNEVLTDIALAYRQGFPNPRPPVELPASLEEVQNQLGSGFVREFASNLESRLGIDIVRLPGLSTAYSFRIGGQPIIAIPANGNWFRANSDIAHELAHLVFRDHDEGLTLHRKGEREAAANKFAADLLLPESFLDEVDWTTATDEELAEFIWKWGVSVKFLEKRFESLRRQVPPVVAKWAAYPTQRLLRKHLHQQSGYGADQITERMDQAAQRRFPVSLQTAHLDRIESGEIGKETLAWLLDIDAESLDVYAPEPASVPTDELVSALGL